MKRTVSRRRALQACGIVVGASLGGCLSSGSEDATTGDPESTQTPTANGVTGLALGETASVPEGRVTVESMTTQRMVVVKFASAHAEVHASTDTQFVVAQLTTEDISDPVETARDEMVLDLGPNRYDVIEKYLVWNRGDNDGVRLAFPVPLDFSETAGTLLWTDDSGDAAASWAVPDGVRDRLTNPPAFRVESFEVTAPPELDDAVEASFEIQNTGSSDGTFLAELGSKQFSDQPQIDVDVPAGERETFVGPVSLVRSDDGSVTVVLDWGMDKLERTVTIES